MFSLNLLLSDTLNAIPKSSRSVDPQYFCKFHFNFHSFDEQPNMFRHLDIDSSKALYQRDNNGTGEK